MESDPQQTTAYEVGNDFVMEYYNNYSEDPKLLGKMYSKASRLAHVAAGAALTYQKGPEAIMEKLASLPRGCKFTLHTVYSVPTVADSILICVNGLMLTRDTTRTFVHTFVLGKNPRGAMEYYIHSDIMLVAEQEYGMGDFEEEAEEEPEPERAEEVNHAQAATEQEEEEAVAELQQEPEPPSRTPPTRPAQRVSPKVVPQEPQKPPSSYAAAAARMAAAARAGKQVVQAPQATVTRAPAVTKAPAPQKGGKGGKGDSGAREGGKGGKGGKGKSRYHTIFVTRVPKGMTDDDVKEIFGKHKDFVGHKLIPAGPKQNIYVDFSSKDGMDAALAEGASFDGQNLNMQPKW